MSTAKIASSGVTKVAESWKRRLVVTPLSYRDPLARCLTAFLGNDVGKFALGILPGEVVEHLVFRCGFLAENGRVALEHAVQRVEIRTFLIGLARLNLVGRCAQHVQQSNLGVV